MKTPDEIKKGLAVCATLDGDCENCPYDDGKQLTCVDRSRRDALAYIIQLESTYSKVSKALCSKENANPDEFLQAVSQVKDRLAQVERERAALLDDLRHSFDPCTVCKKQDICEQYCPDNYYNCPDCKDKHRCICHSCTADNDLWEWRGLCEENTHDQPGM